jgi:hypothetical protein
MSNDKVLIAWCSVCRIIAQCAQQTLTFVADIDYELETQAGYV